MSAPSTAASISDAVRRREVCAVDVCREHLDRIALADPTLGALLARLDERAIEQAATVDRRVESGETLPLAGVPVVVKDVLDIEGQPTTCGSRILEGYRPPFTATCVARLEKAGAVLVGKANMDEFAMGSSNENSAYFAVRNPWDVSRVPGGSSGGSAVAVAAGMAPVALGTDTGGSIRQPAAFCGIVGLKPTWGRVSRYGLVAFASSLDQVGPFARTTEDCALLSEILFGHDPADSTSSRESVPELRAALCAGIEGLRIGVPWSFLEKGIDAGVLDRFREALSRLEDGGARVIAIELPHLPHAIATYYIVATAEASSNLARFDGVRYGKRVEASDLRGMYGATRDAGFGAEVKRRILLGTYVLSSGYYDAYYLRAQKVRTLIRQDFDQAFGACDVVATPTTPTPAFRLGEKLDDPLQMYLADIFTVPANLAGIPGLSVPAGLVDGLPTGLQLLGRLFEEATLLRVGAAFERSVGGFPAPPAA